jgi:plastocyanin
MTIQTKAMFRPFLLATFVLSIALSGCGSDDDPVEEGGGGGDAADHEVNIQSFAFSPAALTIAVGESVNWTNNDAAVHTTTSGTPTAGSGDIWDSGNLAAGGTFERTFDEAGDFPYYCVIHGISMTATITVE